MTLITLSFTPEMEEAILQGKKCCTTRFDKKDADNKPILPYEIGDRFVVRDRMYEIVGVQRRCIQDVYVSYLSCEGFRNTEDTSAGKQFEKFFSDVLNLPRETWGKPCWVYFFAYVGPAHAIVVQGDGE